MVSSFSLGRREPSPPASVPAPYGLPPVISFMFNRPGALYGTDVYKRQVLGEPWVISSIVRTRPWLAYVLAFNFCLVAFRFPVRMATSARIYGWRFALWAPVRLLWANFINAAATFRALRLFAESKLRHLSLIHI